MKRLVVLFDVDNTLFRMDAFKQALNDGLAQRLGQQLAGRFWQVYEDVRERYGHVDVPETIRLLTHETHDPRCALIASFVESFPYHHLLFDGVLDVLRAIEEAATPVILSDGDPVFQREKVERSGLAEAVGGRVLIYFHKEDHIAEVLARYPAERYWMVDDKARLLGKYKARLGDSLTTFHVLQGHYAAAPADPGDPPPDKVIRTIADLVPYLPVPTAAT